MCRTQVTFANWQKLQQMLSSRFIELLKLLDDDVPILFPFFSHAHFIFTHYFTRIKERVNLFLMHSLNFKSLCFYFKSYHKLKYRSLEAATLAHK